MPYLKTCTDQPADSGPETHPDDPDWDSARAPWNRAIEQHPSCIVHPRDVADLRRLLDRAVTDGTTLTTQPNGHGAAGSLTDSILIRPTAFQEVRIDTDRRLARVGAGVCWGALLQRLGGTGLVAPAGSNPSINVVAFLLAGGHSWFSRRLGQGARSVRAFEIVLPDGDHRRIDADDVDLFWALRGAGGALGVVTAVEIDLTPVGALVGGQVLFPGDHAVGALTTALAVGESAPEHFSLQATLLRMPDHPSVPVALRGQGLVSVAVLAEADDAATDRLLARLRSAAPVLSDSVGAVRVQELGAVAAEPCEPAAGRERAFLADLDDSAIAALVDTVGSPVGAPIAGVQIRVLGGALARPVPGDGIAGTVAARHLVQTVVPVAGHRDDPAASAALDAVVAAAGTTRRPGLVATFLSPGQSYADAYPEVEIQRLQQVKDLVDPLGLIVGNRSVS